MIHVIGSKGCIGNAIKKAGRRRKDIKYYSSRNRDIPEMKEQYFSLDDEYSWDNIKIAEEDVIIFLSWKKLINYNKTFHITENLRDCTNFTEYIAKKHPSKIVMAGTCAEYGPKNGSLNEETALEPKNYYAIAKKTLFETATLLCKANNVDLAWLRLFYVYGQEQNRDSLVPSMHRAEAAGEKTFTLSGADLVRDFISVEDAARIFLSIADIKQAKGAINLGSGKGQTVKTFAENYIDQNKLNLKLIAPTHVAQTNKASAFGSSFWANCSRLNSLMNENGATSYI